MENTAGKSNKTISKASNWADTWSLPLMIPAVSRVNCAELPGLHSSNSGSSLSTKVTRSSDSRRLVAWPSWCKVDVYLVISLGLFKMIWLIFPMRNPHVWIYRKYVSLFGGCLSKFKHQCLWCESWCELLSADWNCWNLRGFRMDG